MEASAERWLADLEMEQFWETMHSLSSVTYNSNPCSFNPMVNPASNTGSPIEIERPKKILKANTWNSSATEMDTSLPTILSFGNPDSWSDQSKLCANFIGPKGLDFSTTNSPKRKYEMVQEQGTKSAMPLPARDSSTQYHILAERKRREKLGKQFIALSAIIPGLKKLDKVSVLGDAIKHMNQLKEKVKALENEASKRTIKSAVLVKKSQLSSDDYGSSCDKNFDGSGESLPEIEVKMSGKRVLVRVNCENRKGLLTKALSEIENLKLAIVNASAVPFTDSINITITAQVEEDSTLILKDLVMRLSSALKGFM